MPIVEWENLDELLTPEGSLALNDPTSPNGYYVTAKEGAESGSAVRSTGDPVPQSGGTIWHRGFDNGYQVKLAIQYWIDEHTPANKLTSPTAQQMDDLLMKHLRSILAVNTGRLFYSPQGENRRLMDACQVIAQPILVEGDAFSGTVVTLGSEFPYLIDFTQLSTPVLTAGSPTGTFTNAGTAPFFPVIQVAGTFDEFTLTNTTSDQAIIYDSALPGAVTVTSPHYIEIDTFRNTVYLDGSGASRKAGIDILNSEFFPLEVGANSLTISADGSDVAPTVTVLYQAAWW